MKRREFLRRTGLVAAAMIDRRTASAQAADADIWRRFEVTTTVEVLRPEGRTRVWLPTPLADAPYQRTSGDTYRADGGFSEMLERPSESLDMLVAEWPAGIAPLLTMTSRIATRDHSADLSVPSVPPPLDTKPLERYLQPARTIPIDGVVRSTADAITRGAGTDLERARAIYDWIVERVARHSETGGTAGNSDARSVLESGRIGGDSAEVTALFVALARAAGVPARPVYGLRLGASRGDPGLPANDATRAQHCRAELYLTGFGWVPADPAAVHEVARAGSGRAASTEADRRAGQARLFGSWEMNWIAFNYANDIVLPGSKRGAIRYFMHPQAETANGRIDSLDPDAFHYRISVR
jgi:transglutaminase-like putative cysteine protease